MIVARGPDRIGFRGRVIPRASGFVDVPGITCPDGHRMRLGGFTIRDNGGLTCSNKAVSGAGECGAMLWLLYLPGPGHLKRFFVADVEYRELLLWEERHYETEEVLRYLGAWFTRGDDRMPPRALDRRVR